MNKMKFVMAPTVPETWDPSTYYMIAQGTDLMSIYVTNEDASSVRHIPLVDEISSSTIVFSETAPVLSVSQNLWWDTKNGNLMVKYNDGTTTAWVESVPSVAIPEFAGTGFANTMARSDHWHEGVSVMQADW